MRERGGDKYVVMGKPEAKRPLERPRHRWDNFKNNLQKVG